ncbi:MAG: hypothetical protein KGL40_04855 [Rhodocyclaceae bacterium]|nr:hypothetical protein [Rhodocyclaceae bacterium]
MSLKALVAIAGVLLMLVGRFCIYRVSRRASQLDGPGTLGDKIKSEPRLSAWYRFGQSHYFMGVAAFAAAFFI